MSGLPVNDSIGRGENYYNNPYRFEPGASKGFSSLEARRKHPEVKLSSQDRLESHLLAEFKNNRYHAPKGAVVLVAEVGRYMILAVVLPPYYLFFALPRMLIFELFPLFTFMKDKGEEALETLYLKISAWTLDIYRAFEKRLSKAKKKLLKTTESLRFPENPFKGAKETLKKVFLEFNRGAEAFKKAAEAIQSKGINLVEALHQKIQETLSQSKVAIQKMQGSVQENMAVFSESIKNLFEKRGNVLSEQMSKIVSPLPLIIAPISSTLKAALLIPISSIEKGVKKIQEGIKVVQRRTAKVLERTSEKVAPAFESVAKAVSSSILSIRNFAATSAKTVQEVASRHIQAAQFRIVGLMTPLFQRTKEVFSVTRHSINGLKASLQIIFKRAFEAAKEGSEKGFKKAVIFLSKSLEKGEILIRKVSQAAFSFFRFFLSLLKKWVSRLLNGAKKIFRIIRLTFTWTKILVLYSFQHIGISKENS